jgi:hypothetical protein
VSLAILRPTVTALEHHEDHHTERSTAHDGPPDSQMPMPLSSTAKHRRLRPRGWPTPDPGRPSEGDRLQRVWTNRVLVTPGSAGPGRRSPSGSSSTDDRCTGLDDLHLGWIRSVARGADRLQIRQSRPPDPDTLGRPTRSSETTIPIHRQTATRATSHTTERPHILSIAPDTPPSLPQNTRTHPDSSSHTPDTQ